MHTELEGSILTWCFLWSESAYISDEKCEAKFVLAEQTAMSEPSAFYILRKYVIIFLLHLNQC